MRSGIKVFAPASVANVACGFDILGFALEKPGDEIIARTTDRTGLSISKITGDQGRLPYDIFKNTAGLAALRLLESLDMQSRGIELEIHKKMPFGSGLGSSAASAAGAVVAVNELVGRPLTKSELLPFAVLGEQVADGAYHADNVGPALLGGLLLIRDNDVLDFYRIPVPIGLTAAVVYPHIEILTKDARNIISKEITLQSHIKQSGNLAGFVLGMLQSNYELIAKSLSDQIIEPQRAQMIPHFYEVKNAALNQDALGCSISGAGPSIFALYNNSLKAENGALAMQEVFNRNKIISDIFVSPINLEGTVVY
ncbi:MAG: homoserine kinase [Saprospiraceae bacterium]|nr:homoserine kinase [Saprospiraceae bacterium]